MTLEESIFVVRSWATIQDSSCLRRNRTVVRPAAEMVAVIRIGMDSPVIHP